MENRVKILKMLSTNSNSDWKVGKTDSYIQAISAKIDTLPTGVFDGFFIDEAKTKKISTVDFALMTYDMSPTDQNHLMELYGIHPSTISEILTVVDEIAEIASIEPAAEVPTTETELEAADRTPIEI